MEYKSILYEKFDTIAKITVNRPEVKNAQSRVVLEEITEAFSQAEADDGVRVIVVAGAGPDFSAGHDLGSAEEREDRERRPWTGTSTVAASVRRTERLHWDFTMAWRNIGKPTIAMVQGYCIMGGWILASACDIIVVSEDAKIADRGVRWGMSGVQYSTFPWDLGQRKAKEYLWTGDYIDGKEAFRLGMVNRVVPKERLEEETMALAKRIALNDPFALKLSKLEVNQAMDIMGQSAALRSSHIIHSLSTQHRREITPEEAPTGTESARARDRRFGD